MKPAEILHRLNTQYGEETLSHAGVCDVYIKVSEGHKEISDLLHAHIQPAAVCDVNICCVQELILGSRRITACDIAFSSGISVGNVEAVIREYLLLKKCVPGGSQRC
jgi:hypothetical protein